MDTILEFLVWSSPVTIPFLIGAALSGFLTWSRMSAKLDAKAREMSRTVAEASKVKLDAYPENPAPHRGGRQVPVQRAFRAQPHDQDATVVMNVIRPEEGQ